MSCSKKNTVFENKPKDRKNTTYVWKEVYGNPNLYCWIPVSKKDIKPLDLDLEDVNIQDIPPPVEQEAFEDIIANIAEEAQHNKQKDALEKLKKSPTDTDIVSVDEASKYKIVKQFIQKKGLKLYGGTAINSYLPKEEKFYNKFDLPDYDFFSPDPWNDCVELADIFHQKGYKYIEARAGIHKGTYKVFVNMWPVADISYMPKKQFDMMETTTIDGIKVVSPFKLLESMYKEFSEPYANPARWPKVATREKLLLKWAKPLNKKFKCSPLLFSGGKVRINTTLAILLEATYAFIEEKNMLLGGAIAYNTYLEAGGAPKRVVVDHYYVFSEKASDEIQELFTVLMKIYKELEITTQYYPSKELNNTSYKLFAVIDNRHHLVCEMVHLTSCTPYQRILGREVVSIDYLKYELYDRTVFSETKQERDDAKCKIQYISKVQEKYYQDTGIPETHDSLFQRYLTKCKGPFQENVKVAVLNRWLEKISNKDKVIKEWTPEYKIRKIPREQIPNECLNVPKDLCRYPCAWNKFLGRCTGIPTGTYRPDDPDPEMNYEYVG